MVVSTIDDPAAVAQASADKMWANDRVGAAFGMSVDEVGPGTARVSMLVRGDMVNGFGSCHGGIISALADTAFALACNSRGTVTVAAGFEIDFLKPAVLGDRLGADAREVSVRGRSGIYDVTVRSGETVIAEFRGRSRALGRPIQEEER